MQPILIQGAPMTQLEAEIENKWEKRQVSAICNLYYEWVIVWVYKQPS